MPFDLEDLDHKEIIPNRTISSLDLPEIGGFGRLAQAAFLLDEVLKALQIEDIDSRLVNLDAIDAALQKYLAVVMRQCHEALGGFYCGAIALAIRSVHRLPALSSTRFGSRSLA